MVHFLRAYWVTLGLAAILLVASLATPAHTAFVQRFALYDSTLAINAVVTAAQGLRVDIGRSLTTNGDALVDDTNDALRVTNVTTVTTQGRTQTLQEFTVTDADNAQTNLALITVAAGTKIRVTYAAVICNPANTVSVAWRLGFATATLPAAALAGAAGVFHSGWAQSATASGLSAPFTGVAEGASNEDLRLTMDDPVTGSCRVLIQSENIAS
jgi:hypothetical protein